MAKMKNQDIVNANHGLLAGWVDALVWRYPVLEQFKVSDLVSGAIGSIPHYVRDSRPRVAASFPH